MSLLTLLGKTPTVGTGTVSFVAAGAQTENTSASTTLVLPYPAGMVANDLMILFTSVTAANVGAATLNAGWTGISLHSCTTDSQAPNLYLAYKWATGSESGSYSANCASAVGIGQLLAFRGVNLTTPMDTLVGEVDSGTTNSSILPSLTTTVANTALVYAGAQNSVANNATPPASPGTFIETADRSAGTRSSTLGYQIWSGSGATGTATISWSGSARNIGAWIALRPAAAAPTDFIGWGIPI